MLHVFFLLHCCSTRDRFRGEPLAPGCISVFVRGGDKAAESAVFTSEHYEAVAKRLRQVDPALTNQVRRLMGKEAHYKNKSTQLALPDVKAIVIPGVPLTAERQEQPTWVFSGWQSRVQMRVASTNRCDKNT
jgi:hypothetical protein